MNPTRNRVAPYFEQQSQPERPPVCNPIVPQDVLAAYESGKWAGKWEAEYVIFWAGLAIGLAVGVAIGLYF
jgi:hypothetical protein